MQKLAWVLKRVDLMLRVPTTKKTQHSKSHWHEETFGDDECVYYIDCDDSIMGVYTCPNSLNCIYYIHAVFVYQLHCHKAKKWL